MKIEILKLQHNDIDDFSDLIKIFEKIFEWQNILFPSKTHLQKVIDNPRFIVFAAKAHNKLIGGLTAHIFGQI